MRPVAEIGEGQVREPERRRDGSSLLRMANDAAQFLRDIFWLFGWGVRRLTGTDPEKAPESGWRGGCGCLLSLLAVLSAALLLRRRSRGAA